MKLLHTSDWHVGKSIRGISRADEHRAVLAEIVGIAEERAVDLVVVAGDLFDSAAPGPDAEDIVYRALLGLARSGAEVVVISGNHDNARRLRAVAPLLELGQVHLVTEPLRPADGGVRVLPCRGGGEVRVALLPFVSQRGIVRADALMTGAAYEHAQLYADRLRRLVDALTAGFDDALANLVVAHAFVLGASPGGGERHAHLVEAYQVGAQSFPATASYVALGHLHRPQKVPGATAIHYCGSPLQLDFGEAADPKQVNLVELEAGLPARVEAVPLRQGRELRTVRTTLADLDAAVAALPPDSWLRVDLREARRAGIAEEVRRHLGDRAVDVRIDDPGRRPGAVRHTRRGRSPAELFAEFCGQRNVADPRVAALFAELHEEVSGGDDEDVA